MLLDGEEGPLPAMDTLSQPECGGLQVTKQGCYKVGFFLKHLTTQDPILLHLPETLSGMVPCC